MRKTTKKTLVMVSSLLMSLTVAGVVSANPALPEANQIKADKAYKINADLENVLVRPGGGENGPVYEVIDRNPNRYTKQAVGGHTVESWLNDNIAYTAVDGTVTKAYKINADLKTVLVRPSSGENGPKYEVIDRNPTRYSKVVHDLELYNKKVANSHTLESWTKNGVVYTAVNGVVTKAYQINGDLETVPVRTGNGENSPEYAVIDHNPNFYSKQAVGGHTVESWLKDGVVYTAVKE